MKVFKTVDGTKVDVVKHTLSIIQKDHDVEIHVGTDSQSKGRLTTYVICIAYRFGTRGVHYIYYKEKVPRIQDKYTKLFREAELTIEIAQWLSSKIRSVKLELDFDFNLNEKYFSNKLVYSVKGWAVGLGFKPNFKPNKQIATLAADYHCR